MVQKTLLGFLVCLSFVLASSTIAQQQWRANLTFNPRPSPYLDEWRSNGTMGTLTVFNPESSPALIVIIFQVMNLSTNKIVLKGRTSPQNVNAFPSPTILTNPNFIGSTGLQYDESQKVTMIRTGMIPEGEYSLCLTLENMSHQKLADNICSNFHIVSADPPQLLSPQHRMKLEAVPNSFVWTPVQSPSGGSVYDMKLVEVFGSQSPTDALRTNPPVVEEHRINSPTFVLNADLSQRLKKGSTYAWRVRVLDAGERTFAHGDGYSEIYTFTMNGSEKEIKGIEKINPGVTLHSEVKGVIQYAFADPFGKEGLSVYPLKTTKLRLVVRHFTQSGNKKTYYGDDSTIASTTTDGAGNFSFKTTFTDSTGEIGIGGKGKKNINDGNGQGLYRSAFVIIDDIHYTSPENDIVISKGKTVDAGAMHGLVRSFGLNVTIKDIKPPYVVGGATLYLFRMKKGDDIPEEEGFPRPVPPVSLFGAPCIGKATTDAFGRASFGRLVQCYYDEQYLIIVAPPNEFSGYHYPSTVYPATQSGNFFYTPLFVSPTMNSEYKWQEFPLEISPDKITSGVKGKLVRGFDGSKINNTPLTNTNVRLQIRYENPGVLPANFAPDAYPDNGKVIAYGKTNPKGEFEFSFDDVPKNSGSQGVTRMYRVIVDDKHFTSPDNDVMLEPGEIKNIGIVTANIRSYNLKCTTVKSKGGTPMPAMYVYVRRPDRAESVPSDEGSPHPDPPITRSGEDVVAVGLTSFDEASVTLTRLIRCYGEYERYHFEVVSDPTTGKNYLGFDYDDFSDNDDVAEFNSQYLTPTFERTIKVFALPAAITGRVLREDNTMTPIPGALVLMSITYPGDPDWHPKGAVTTTDKDGYYYINGNQANGSGRRIQASKGGFHDSKYVDLPQNINEGEQAYNELTMMPKGVVKGKIYFAWTGAADSHTGYDNSWVTVEGGTSVYTSGEFSLPTNLDEPSSVLIEPDDHSYFPDTLLAYSPHATERNLGDIYVMKKLHRIAIRTFDEDTHQPISFQIVATEMASSLYPGSVIPPSSQDGDTSFWLPFESSDQYFSFTTYTNTDADYEHRTYTVHNSVSKSPILYDLKTRKAGFISGTVYLYSKKSGKKDVIDNAKIRLEQGSSDGETGFPMNPNLPGSPGSKKNPSDPFKLDELYAYSGYSLEHKPGHYKLGNIPVGKHSFMASKSKSGTIGEEKVLNIPKEGLKNVDFFLQVYEDMDITQMLGIPMDVEKLDSTKTGVYITGSLSELPASPHFSAAPATELGFTSIKIVPGSKKGAQGVPYPKPDVLPMQSNVKSFPITYNYSPTGKYNAVLKSLKSCLTVNAAADEKGSVIGSLYIPANQFSPKLSFGSATENGFYLSGYNKVGKMLLFFEVLSSDGKDPFSDSPQGLNICNSKGTDANYTLLSFNAHFESAKSFLRGDSITLATIIDLPPPGGGKATIPLTIGNVRLRGSDVAISSLANSTLPEIALDKWVLQGKKISFMGDNLVMDGSVKTGTLDIPFTGMPITPQGWKPENAVFTLSQLSIAGIIPLALSGSVKFGHDISSMPPCWKLQSSGKGDKVVASFGGIKGMPVQDSIYVTSFSLTSFGSNSFLLKPDVPIHFYGLVTFVPNVLTVSSSGVDIKGNDQLFVAGGFNYSDRTLSLFSQAGLISFDSKKLLFDISKYYAKGTQLDFPLSGQELNENGFFATGVLVDAVYPKSYNFPVKLSCIPDSTAVTVLPQNSAGIATTFPIGKDGSKYLNNIVGDLRYDYDAKAWSNLSFSGSLQGANGATSTMSFKVSGAIQTDGDQKIAVTNIPSPFGEATMTFNFSTGAMHGAINVKADLPGAGHLDGQADLQIDQSGWYFAAAGDLQLYNPNIGIQAALILGSYPNIQSITEVTEKFDKLPWKPEVPQAMRSIPQEYNNLGGFYFCGEALNFLGITLPSIDVDLDPIVHCSVNFYYGAALSLGMNFSQGKQFNMGAAVFIGVDADAGGSIGIACGGGTLHGGLSLFGMGSFNTSNGNWSVTGACDVLLKGSLYAGWGICSSSCGWKTCDKHEWGPASMTFGLINFHASSNGVSISP